LIVASIAFGVGHIRDNPVCGKSSGSEYCNVVVARDVRPMLLEDGSTIGIDLAERDGSHSGSFEAKRETADA
jgi:hypothetical protein